MLVSCGVPVRTIKESVLINQIKAMAALKLGQAIIVCESVRKNR